MSNPFGDTKRLGFFVEHLAQLRRWSWLYIAGTETSITLDTLCLPTAIDSRDMSEEEFQEFEIWAQREGLHSFLNRNQLEEVIENLRQQCAEYTPQQLATAINFYWQRDAFIDLSKLSA